MGDYTKIGLDKNLRAVESYTPPRDFTSSFDFDSQFDPSSVGINQLNRDQSFKLERVTTTVTATITSNSIQPINYTVTVTSRRKIVPTASLINCYVDTVDDTHILNSTNLSSSLTSDQSAAVVNVILNRRQNEINPKTMDFTVWIWNLGTASHDYTIKSYIGYVPIK